MGYTPLIAFFFIFQNTEKEEGPSSFESIAISNKFENAL